MRTGLLRLALAFCASCLCAARLESSREVFTNATTVRISHFRGDNEYCQPEWPICNNPVLGVPHDYNYVPSVMLDGEFRVWWCAGNDGDVVMLAESSNMTTGWSSATQTFGGTHVAGDWDGLHTCDPSVLRVEDTTYLYYGGYPMGPVGTTQIGVAVSTDNGKSFHRVRSTPIISPALVHNVSGAYGCGQPSVIHLDGLFYILYTDTTGRFGYGNFAYVMRSPDPFFQNDVEELHGVGGGWWPYSEANHTVAPLLNCASVDWVYSDVLERFLVGCDGYAPNATRVMMYDRELSQHLGYVDAPGDWTEGPGLLKRPDQHSPFNWDTARPTSVPLDVLRSWGPGGPATWGPPSGGLAHGGGDLKETPAPVDMPQRQIRALEGSGVQASGMPLAVVVNGTRVQVAVAGTADCLTANFFDVIGELFSSIPYGASIFEHNRAIGAPGRPGAFVLDDGRKWPVSCDAIVIATGSSLEMITAAEYDAIPSGPSLFCRS